MRTVIAWAGLSVVAISCVVVVVHGTAPRVASAQEYAVCGGTADSCKMVVQAQMEDAKRFALSHVHARQEPARAIEVPVKPRRFVVVVTTANHEMEFSKPMVRSQLKEEFAHLFQGNELQLVGVYHEGSSYYAAAIAPHLVIEKLPDTILARLPTD
ncbi:MAG: hypothetical protein JWO43_473 [Candidatus Adlerbacteria bacterium]|nr:hypothetical protein [Candidatus Adlerbacteria bacterium]